MACNIHQLNETMQDILPLLDQNLQRVESGFNAGNVTFADYYNIATRHQVLEMLWRQAYPHDMRDIEQEAFEQTVIAFTDLNAMVAKAEGAEKEKIDSKRLRLLSVFRENGFTEDHSKYVDYPMHPNPRLNQ